jgi:HEAT repeat protein
MMDAGRNYIPKLWNRVFGINDPKVVRMQNAVWAFDRLGAQAAPAIPDLIRLMKKGSEDLAWTASSILGGMGENAVPVLLEVLTNRQTDLRFRTAALGTAIRHPPTNGALLVPVLMPYLTNLDAECRGLAATMLGELQAMPSNAVPGLVGLLRDQDGNTRYRAINALGRFGTDARGACASLLPVLKDSDGSMRQAAEIALRAIAPEVLENAGAGSGRN